MPARLATSVDAAAATGPVPGPSAASMLKSVVVGDSSAAARLSCLLGRLHRFRAPRRVGGVAIPAAAHVAALMERSPNRRYQIVRHLLAFLGRP